jgi:1-acyl-sn-glycerol-3-phosphate acyltransferase
MRFCTVIPYGSNANAGQTAQSPMTYDELRADIRPPTYKWYQRLFQILCFFVFLGPLGVIILLLSVIIVTTTIFSIRLVCRALGVDTAYVMVAYPLIALGARLFVLALGIAWVRCDGDLDPRTRVVLANHVGFLDPLIFIAKWRITFICKKEFRDVAFLRALMDCIHPLYVDRTKSSGATQQIIGHIQDPNEWPLMIFPEGTIAGGNVVLKFHRGGFFSTSQIQPAAIRYIVPFLPKRWNTYLWVGQKPLDLFWGFLSMPLTICDIKWMNLEIGPGLEGDPEKAAGRTQLMMANELGLRAVDIGSDMLFHQKYQQQRAGGGDPAVIRRDPQPGT